MSGLPDAPDVEKSLETIPALPSVPPIASKGPRIPLDSITSQHRRELQSSNDLDVHQASEIQRPPSFAQSEFETIIRRQRSHTPHCLKISDKETAQNPNVPEWQFAGWGSILYVDILAGDLVDASERMKSSGHHLMGQWRATSIAGNGVLGSVFYAFPAVAAAAGIFSPISLAVACATLFLFRPILLELASAVRINGSNYIYMLQFSGKLLGLVGAAATLLDAVATSVVSSATAAAYLAGEFQGLPLPHSLLAIILLVGLSITALVSMRESSRLTLTITLIHVLTMTALMIASVIAWARTGSSVLVHNWTLRPAGASNIAHSIFNGVCLGFLGTTGIECTPSYIENVRKDAYPAVIRNLLYGALFLNAPLMLFVYAMVPSETILSGANVLSVLAEVVAGKWLRIILVVDCMLVLAGGVLAGLFTVCGLVNRLAHDRIVPPIFLKTLPVTGSAYISVALFLVLSLILYASSTFSLATVSSVFSVSFLFVMILFAMSALLLHVNRARLPRDSPTNMFTILLALIATIAVLIGNAAQSPKILGIYAAYIIAVFVGISIRSWQLQIAHLVMWIYTQAPPLQRFRLDALIVRWIRSLRGNPVCVWVKTDDIFTLLDACLYVRSNEPTARLVFVHAYETLATIPTELKANCKILDEAFPDTTIDLIFLRGVYSPVLAEAVSVKLDVPLSHMLMASPGPNHPWRLGDYRGVRVYHA